MFNSELRSALRTLYREKSYTLINLSGLSLAIACVLILSLYLRSELTYDRHHVRHREIFRVVNEFTMSGSATPFVYTSLALGPLLKKNYPEVKDYVRFRPASLNQRALIRAGDIAFYCDQVWYADDNVFDVFTHRILYGDPKTALKDPASAAVSETFAKKYFGDGNPIGKTIQADLSTEVPRKITLVFRDLPKNTHLKYEVLFPETAILDTTHPERFLFAVNCLTYLVMPKNYNVNNFPAIMNPFYARFMESRAKAMNGSWKAWLQPLANIHLYSDTGRGRLNSNLYYVFSFTAVALFILLVACINSVNLAIARAAKRTKEIGIRKILCVPRMHLISRFLGESVFLSMAALILGAALAEIALKLISIHTLQGVAWDLSKDPVLLLWMLCISIFIGLLSGIYPAFYLSSLKPLSALTGSIAGKGDFRLREMLVLLQFTVSVIVIACTLIMAMQLRYISRKPLGFEKHHRVLINLHGPEVSSQYPIIKSELSKDSRILGITSSSWLVGAGTGIPNNAVPVETNEGALKIFGFDHIAVDSNYLDVMGIQLVLGQDFSKKQLSDLGSPFIVNEAMVKAMGWQQALGKQIQALHQGGTVIGVVKDFNIKSLHSRVDPLVLYPFGNDSLSNQRILIIKISDQDTPQTLKFLQEKFLQFDSKHPFEYAFLDDTLDNLYVSEYYLMKMMGIFSGICVFISCLGLFALATFATEQRNKEIGIRKVLGASASQIIMMLVRKTLWLVLAGSIAASIIAYYAIDVWLSGFAYQVSINPLVFILSAALVILVAFITVALQSYKAAQSNPAAMIRYE